MGEIFLSFTFGPLIMLYVGFYLKLITDNIYHNMLCVPILTCRYMFCLPSFICRRTASPATRSTPCRRNSLSSSPRARPTESRQRPRAPLHFPFSVCRKLRQCRAGTRRGALLSARASPRALRAGTS